MRYILIILITFIFFDGCSRRVNIHTAAKIGNVKLINKAIRQGQDIDAEYYDRRKKVKITPLFFAVENNKYDAVKYLVKNGANINIVTQTGETPIINAVINNRYSIAKFLLENGAEDYSRINQTVEPKYKRYIGKNALDIARSEKRDSFVRLLEKKGSVINAKPKLEKDSKKQKQKQKTTSYDDWR